MPFSRGVHSRNEKIPPRQQEQPAPEAQRREDVPLQSALIVQRIGNDATASAHEILHLQRTIGNQAVGRLLTRTQHNERAVQPRPSIPARDVPSIQRYVEWREGERQRTNNLTETVTRLADFGTTPAIFNSQEFPGGGDPTQAVFPPSFTFEELPSGHTTLKVSAEPINIVSYRMILPTKPPWKTEVSKELALSAIGILSNNNLQEKLQSRMKDTTGNTCLVVKGLPNDQAFAQLVEQHEEHHVDDLHRTKSEILDPWDARIRAFKEQDLTITAESREQAKEEFYNQVGGTPAEIGNRLVDDSRDKGVAFHKTHEGGSPTLYGARTTADGKKIEVYWRHPLS